MVVNVEGAKHRGRIQLIRKKRPWPGYLLSVVLVMVPILIGQIVFFSRFGIGIDEQAYTCIPGKNVYLIDYQDREIRRGNIYLVRSKDLTPIYKEGTKLIKYVRALAGDRVEVDSSDRVLVNGVVLADGLPLAREKLARAPESFRGVGVLKEDEVWVMGTAYRSFDSRYWGPVTRDRIVGRAYALF